MSKVLEANKLELKGLPEWCSIETTVREAVYKIEEEKSSMIDSSLTDKVIGKLKKIYDNLDKNDPESIVEARTSFDLSLTEEIDEVNSGWSFVSSTLSSKLVLIELENNYKRLFGIQREDNEDFFVEWIQAMAEEKYLSKEILEAYSEDDLKEAYSLIDNSLDSKMTGIGYYTLISRYCRKSYKEELLESPQMRFLIISLDLNRLEDKSKRMNYVKESYWALSGLYMTVATPTLTNAGDPNGQYSSCFIDTVNDSLDDIYNSNGDIAQLSKFGGGIGVYVGKVRARGSSIRGYQGKSSGVLPWIKQLNNTAVSVDQLGQRQGAVAVYLDMWHLDITMFLDLKLNNGDERLRAHDIFTGVSIPDIFMEAVEEERITREPNWYLFDPHDIRVKKGWSLEDYYDEEDGDGTFRRKYQELVEDESIRKEKVSALGLMARIMKSQIENGVPFMFYRDTVNRENPNRHKGMIYSSNLCTEIAQNMNYTEQIEEIVVKASDLNLKVVDGMDPEQDLIVSVKKPGEMVVCNLSSINLGQVTKDYLKGIDVLERLINIQVRMLDNVIDINNLPLRQAELNNSKYRAVGLGTFGWHHSLALRGMEWESEDAVKLADKLYEKIAYLTIKASADLSEEKGAYPYFEGSDWETGEYFTRRGYIKSADEVESIKPRTKRERWKKLSVQIKVTGIRNGYLMAIAPNSTTSIIAGSTASIDPVFNRFYYEEKKNYRLPNPAPDLNPDTYSLYERAHIIDQRWSIEQNAARQRHIDQAISFNIYIPNSIKAKVLLDLHLMAWSKKIKTTYYTRSTASNIEECEWCHS